MSYTTTATVIISILTMTLIVKNIVLLSVNRQSKAQKAFILLSDLSALVTTLYFYLVITKRIFAAPYFLNIGGFAFSSYSIFAAMYLIYTTRPTKRVYSMVLFSIVFVLTIANIFLNEFDFVKRIDLVYLSMPSIKSILLLQTQVILTVITSVLGLKIIKYTNSKAELVHSSTQKFQFSWLSLQFKCLISFSVAMVILFFFGNTPLVANEFIKEIIIMTLFYLVVLVTTFGCIEQAPISEEEMEVSNEIELSFLENKSASDESEDYDEYEKIVDSVVKCVKEKELFLDADLKLNSLSNKCNIPSYQISKSINFTLNKNFNEFINDFRIVEAKRKLSSSEFENVTILAIALESGFNSKSSFNAQFKKRENITPNEYRSTHSSK